MEWLNYHHLLYFWMVAREGGLAPAGKALRLSIPTLSSQVHALEDRLGEKLFTRQGRRLVLTEFGRVAFRYADDIFSLGREMLETLKGQAAQTRITVGVLDVVPKLVVRRLLQPALELRPAPKVVCLEDSFDKLLSELALHAFDLIIADAPVPSGSAVKAYHHLLGETGISFFATEAIAKQTRGQFPRSLDGAAMLLPLETMELRRSLNHWFERQRVRPRVVGEFEDSALIKVFGSDGVGIFPGPTIIEREICEQYGVRVLGRTTEVMERFFAISVDRKLKNPAAVAIFENARARLFRP
ncbi:MAG: transcriptional activator NhaR [Archangium sp.]|nr:transcriptional activator NhaR [Archangium sp.]